MRKIVLITGASSGFGYELAKKIAQKGHTVYGVARNVEKIQELSEYGVIALKMDVQDGENVNACVAQIIQEQGRIDIVYNNAGYGLFGAVEAASMDAIFQQYDVNVFGVQRVLQAVLPHMRAQREGRIIMTGSVVSELTLPYGAWYASTKHALKSIADGLRGEVAEFGIKVSTIQPGAVETGFRSVAINHMSQTNHLEDYLKTEKEYEQFQKFVYKFADSMHSTINAMVHAGFSSHPKYNYRTTRDSKITLFFKNIIGASNIAMITRFLYGKVK